MKGRPLTLRTCSASEQHSVGPPQRGARPSRHEGVLEARRAAGSEKRIALRRLQLDELDLRRERGDRGLVLELLRRRGLAPVREGADLCARIFFFFFTTRVRRDDLVYALELTRHLWYSIMARALSIFLRGSRC